MIANKAKTGIEPIDYNRVCEQVASDLVSKFPDKVKSVAKPKHKVNHAVLTITAKIKRLGPKNQYLDAGTINTMVDYITANLKANQLIPNNFKSTFSVVQHQFTSIITINLKA